MKPDPNYSPAVNALYKSINKSTPDPTTIENRTKISICVAIICNHWKYIVASSVKQSPAN